MANEKRIVIAFGRFNPPTTGHARLIIFLTQTANRLGADARVYASPTTDTKKNPLPFREKVQFLRQLFPRVTFNNNPAMNTPFAAYADASAAGYKDITVIVGADRVRDFEKFGAYLLPAGSSKYNAAKHIDVTRYRVLAIPRGAGAISATLMRGYVVANDFPSFLAGTPGQNTTVAKKIFTSLRRHMRIREQKAYRKAMQQKMLEAQVVQVEGPLDWGKVDKRNRPPIAEHPFHKLDNMKLRYIQKDAGEAAKAMRGHDRKAEAKYLDQVNDASTILHYRSRGGKQLKEATGSLPQQLKVAKEVYKQLTGYNLPREIDRAMLSGRRGAPAEIIDAAIEAFQDRNHRNPSGRDPLRSGPALNQATKLGIKWDKNKLAPSDRRHMRIEAVTKLGRPAPVRQQVQAALIIFKSFTNGKQRPRASRPGDVVDEAVSIFLKGRHTPEGWYAAGKMLNKATELGIKWDQKLIRPIIRKAMKMDEAVGTAAPKPPSEVDRLRVRQTTDLITLKQRQATELMAAKIRDVETKAREAQTKATAPKGAAGSAS